MNSLVYSVQEVYRIIGECRHAGNNRSAPSYLPFYLYSVPLPRMFEGLEQYPAANFPPLVQKLIVGMHAMQKTLENIYFVRPSEQNFFVWVCEQNATGTAEHPDVKGDIKQALEHNLPIPQTFNSFQIAACFGVISKPYQTRYNSDKALYLTVLESIEKAGGQVNDRGELIAATKTLTGLGDKDASLIERFLTRHAIFRNTGDDELEREFIQFMTTSSLVSGNMRDDFFHFQRHIDNTKPQLLKKDKLQCMTPMQLAGHIRRYNRFIYDEVMEQRAHGLAAASQMSMRQPTGSDFVPVDTTTADVAKIFDEARRAGRPARKGRTSRPAPE